MIGRSQSCKDDSSMAVYEILIMIGWGVDEKEQEKRTDNLKLDL